MILPDDILVPVCYTTLGGERRPPSSSAGHQSLRAHGRCQLGLRGGCRARTTAGGRARPSPPAPAGASHPAEPGRLRRSPPRCARGAQVSTLLPTPDDELTVGSHHLNESQGTMGFPSNNPESSPTARSTEIVKDHKRFQQTLRVKFPPLRTLESAYNALCANLLL